MGREIMSLPRDDPFDRDPAGVRRPELPARGIRDEKLPESGSVAAHASQHGGGSDPLRAGDIGAAPAEHGHLKHNLTATADPTVTDDADSGYSTGSKWVNVSTPAIFVCVTAIVGAADWNQVDASVAAGPHGPSEHTEGTAWRLVYQDVNGDEQEIEFDTAGNVLTSNGVAAAPSFQAATGGTPYTDAEAIAAVPFIQYIPFGSEPITGQSYAP